MSDLTDLYQEVLLDHNKRPRNRGRLPDPTGEAAGHNPLCGDHLEVFLKVEKGVIVDVSFEGTGCAISTASASIMTGAVKGRPVAEAEQMFEDFRKAMTEDGDTMARLSEKCEEIEALGGVRDYPMRVKCATLAWHTLHAALHHEGGASTE